MDAAACTRRPRNSGAIDVDLAHRAPGTEFPGHAHNTIGVRSRSVGRDTSAWSAHVNQRMRSATRTRGHQFPIDCDYTTVSKRVIGIYHGGRSRHVKLSRYPSVSRFVLAPLNWDIVKCADGLVGRGVCARCVWMVASIESPRVAKDSGERRFRSRVIDAGGLIGCHVCKGQTEHAGYEAYLGLVSKGPSINRLAPVWHGGG